MKLSNIGTAKSELNQDKFNHNFNNFSKLNSTFIDQQNKIKLAGGEKAIGKQHKKGRMIARERIDYLIDNKSNFIELGLFAAWEMYQEVGGFGFLLAMAHDWDPWDKWEKSFSLLINEVVPLVEKRLKSIDKIF